MEKVRAELGDRSYNIFIGSGNLDDLGQRVGKFGFGKTIVSISNPTVFGLYGDRVKNSLSHAGFNVYEVIIPDGEEYKNFKQVYDILTGLLKLRLDRRSAVVALGGGVIGDIACFVASIYMRGIACVQVPTTLLSQVDSSVGGKTGVNHELGKNMIGTFYQPSLVWIDTDVLRTLPEREFVAGLAEVIKYGVIRDSELFDYLSMNGDAILDQDAETLSHIIRRSCEIKADIVSEDEREAGIRAVLNFGHTVGHAVETVTEYVRYLHGEAVAMGMCYEAELARIKGLADTKTVMDICSIIKRFRLPGRIPDDIQRRSMLDSMRLDKKAVGGDLRFILPDKIGSVRIEKDISQESVLEALHYRP